MQYSSLILLLGKGSRQGTRRTDVSASGLELSTHSRSSCSHWQISYGSVEEKYSLMNPTRFFRLEKPLGRVKNSLESEGHQSLLAAIHFFSILAHFLCCSAFLKMNVKSGEGKGGCAANFLSDFGQIPPCLHNCFPVCNIGVILNYVM